MEKRTEILRNRLFVRARPRRVSRFEIVNTQYYTILLPRK